MEHGNNSRRTRSADPQALMSEDRLRQGYVIILPGIEGRSRWNRWIRQGLLEAGVRFGIEIHDWTRGPRHYFSNLRDSRRHHEQAEQIAGKIVDYRRQYPTQPVYLIGHSGGAAMSAFALEVLPAQTKVTCAIMLVGALSPDYDLRPSLQRTERGIWNYSAPGDLVFIGIGTALFGTCDGHHSPASGLIGFHPSAYLPQNDDALPTLHQLWFQWRMLRDFNLAGHLSCVNPRFIRRWIAPVILEHDRQTLPDARPPVTARVPSHTAESPPAAPQPTR